VLFGQDRAHEADQGVAVGEDPDDIGAAPDFFVEPLLGVVGLDLAPDLFGERRERQQVRASFFEMISDLGQLVGQRVDDPVILGANRLRIRLVEHRVQQGAHPRPRGLGRDRHEVGTVTLVSVGDLGGFVG
jgi:hypothetical protein